MSTKKFFGVGGSPSSQSKRLNRTSARRTDAVGQLSGWLYKRGETNTAFKKRWFVLVGDQLSYFDDEKATKAKSELALHGSTCEVIAGEASARYHFELTVSDQVCTCGAVSQT